MKLNIKLQNIIIQDVKIDAVEVQIEETLEEAIKRVENAPQIVGLFTELIQNLAEQYIATAQQ